MSLQQATHDLLAGGIATGQACDPEIAPTENSSDRKAFLIRLEISALLNILTPSNPLEEEPGSNVTIITPDGR
jgi:hypothetical protein